MLHWEGGPVWRTRRQTLLRSSRPRVRCCGANAGCALVYRRFPAQHRGCVRHRGSSSHGTIRRRRAACKKGRDSALVSVPNGAPHPSVGPRRPHANAVAPSPHCIHFQSAGRHGRQILREHGPMCAFISVLSPHIGGGTNCPALPHEHPSSHRPLTACTSAPSCACNIPTCILRFPDPACGVSRLRRPTSPRAALTPFRPPVRLSCTTPAAARWPNHE